jgi:hypothetical protein
MEFLNTITQYLPLLALVGTYLLILSYDRAQLPERVKKRGIKTEGTVIEIRHNPGPLFSKTAGQGEAPVVEFKTSSGSYRHHSTNYVTPCPYQVGQKVSVWYYFYKSKQEVILENEDAGSLPRTFLIWGIAFCAIGYPFIIRNLLPLVN